MIKLGPSYFVQFSPDGKWLATCDERSVRVFPAGDADPVVVASLDHTSGGRFAPDSSCLLLKTTSGELWIVEDFNRTANLSKLRDAIGEGCLPAFSRCGKLILDGSWDGQLQAIEISTGALVASRAFPNEMIVGIQNVSAGDWIVNHLPRALTQDMPPEPNYLTQWSLPLASQPKHTYNPGLRFVCALAYSRNRDCLALVHGAPPEHLVLLDLPTSTVRAECMIASGGTGSHVAWSPTGRIATIERNSVRFFTEQLEPIIVYPLKYGCDVAFSPTCDRVAIGSWESGVCFDWTELDR